MTKMSEPIVKRRPMIDLEEFERRLRKPLAANERDDDPLAELARSFASEQEDPYKSVFEPLSRDPAGAWRSEQDHGGDDGKERVARERLIGGDFAAIEAGLLGAAQHENAQSLPESEELVDGREETEGAEHWRYPDATGGSLEAGPPFEEIKSPWPLYVMAAVIIAGVAGIGASFAFRGAVFHQNEIATIRAADGPAKIRPETAAGTEIPDQDASVVGGPPQQPPAAVVNNIEQPADLSASPDVPDVQGNPPRAISGLTTGAASVPVPPPPAQAQSQPSAEPLSIAALIEPKKVKTVSVRPDGTLLPDGTLRPNDAPPQDAAAAMPVPAPRPAAASVPKAATPKSAARVATTPKPVVADASGNPQPPQPFVAAKAKRMELAGAREHAPAAGAPQAPAAGAPQPPAAGAPQAPASGAPQPPPATFVVQLAAPGTEQEARELQVRLMQKFAAELAGFQSSIHKAAVGGKPVYRIRVGDSLSRDEATALCQKVQSSGGKCFVAKN